MTRAALLFALLLTACAPEAPVTTSVLGLTTEVGHQPMSNLGAWTWPSALWDEAVSNASEIRANGGFLVFDAEEDSLDPSIVIRSTSRYNLLGSDPLYWRFRAWDFESEDVAPDVVHQVKLTSLDNRVTATVVLSGTGPTMSYIFRLTEPSETSPFFVVVYDETVNVDYDPALHRWVRIAHDAALGKIRWEAGGETWATVHETDEPTDLLSLTGFQIEFSLTQGFTEPGAVSEVPSWTGPFNEVPGEHTLQLFTEVLPLPVIGPTSELRLVTEVGDDPPDPPEFPEEE